MSRKMLAAMLSALSAAALLGPASVHAQADDAQNAPALEGQVMGGFSATSGDEGTLLQDGWIVDAGFIYWLDHGDGFGLRTDASYSDHAAAAQFRAFGDGWGDVSAAATGPIYRLPLASGLHLYGLAQVGVSHVRLRLFEGGNAYSSVESYSSNRLSWDLGMGLDLATYWRERWFIEVQYRRIEISPRPFEYWPVMVGVRF